jgi:4-hydroxy 2-oxovalerate aldolase
MQNRKELGANGGWVAYRPDIKILDCTIRDGGLISGHTFKDDMVLAVYKALVAAGVDYMEIGYKGDKKIFSPSEFGPWKFCDEDDVRRVVGDNPSDMKLSCMADVGRTDYHTDILPKSESVFDCIRVACYIHQVPAALDMIKDAADKGYETMLQLMAISIVDSHDIEEALKLAARSEVSAVYIVDSFGALYSEQVRDLTKMYLGVIAAEGKEVGFHAHNNMQLAFANTIEAIISGANRVDATISGIGRGAGNCPLELLIAFLHNPKFQMRPVLQACEEIFVPLAREIDWGYSIPYAITGQLNQHPREAIALRASNTPEAYVGFYDRMIEED